MAARGTRRRILLVDDEDDIRVTVRSILELELAGVEVVESFSGDDAIAMFERAPFDLVISDYKMPGMNGAELLNRLRNVWPDVPRVMMTASPDAAAEASGVADVFVRKPFDVDPFIQEIRGLITG